MSRCLEQSGWSACACTLTAPSCQLSIFAMIKSPSSPATIRDPHSPHDDSVFGDLHFASFLAYAGVSLFIPLTNNNDYREIIVPCNFFTPLLPFNLVINQTGLKSKGRGGGGGALIRRRALIRERRLFEEIYGISVKRETNEVCPGCSLCSGL